jgi:DDE superfamily endonuclease
VPSYCPRSSLPAAVLAWLAGRLAHLTPPRLPGRGGTRPLSLEVRPDGRFVATLDDLREVLTEMAAAGEAVVVDGLATRAQRPRSRANQNVLYDPKRHAHTAQGLSVSTVWGGLLWLDGGWPGSCHEHELLALAGLEGALDNVEVVSLLDRGFQGMAKDREHWHAPVGDRHAPSTGSATPSGPTTACRRACERWWNSRRHLAGAWSLRRWRGLLYRVRDVFRAAGCGRADLPGPLAVPGPHMTRASRTPSFDQEPAPG